VDAQKGFPSRDVALEALEGTAYFLKMEVHKRIYWYTTDPHSTANMIPVPVERVREIQAMNRKGIKPDRILGQGKDWESAAPSEDLLQNNSLTRFDPAQPGKNQRHHSNKRRNRRFNDKRNK